MNQSKLEAARMLILAMESLKSFGCMPLSRAAIDDADSVGDAVDRQRIGAAFGSTVLYTVVVELIIKHIWEQEHGRVAPYTHDIFGLFRELKSHTRREIEKLYDTCVREYKAAVNAGRRELGHETVAVDVANLEEALQWNEGAVKNLKYEMTLRGSTVPTGLMWNAETIWVLPGAVPNFAIELTRSAGRSTWSQPATSGP